MTTNRSEAYAAAIVKIAEAEGSLEAVSSELLAVARSVDGNNDLRDKLTDPNLPVATRLKFVESDALAAAHDATRTAVATLIAAGLGGHLVETAQKVAELSAASRDSEFAEVRVAVALDDARRDALKAALERATGKKLELSVVVDPNVLGGVQARVGDTVIDGSIARRLSDIRARLNA